MNIRNLVFWISIIGIIVLGIYLVYYVHSESYQCMNNPSAYAINNLEKANDAEVSCICTAYKDKGTASVILTRDGFKMFDNTQPVQLIFNATTK